MDGTRLFLSDLGFIFLVGFALCLIATSRWRSEDVGRRLGQFALAPLSVGVALLAALLILWGRYLGDVLSRFGDAAEYPDSIGDAPGSVAWLLAGGALLGGAVVADFLLARAVPTVHWGLRRLASRWSARGPAVGASLATWLVLVVPSIGGLAALEVGERSPPADPTPTTVPEDAAEVPEVATDGSEVTIDGQVYEVAIDSRYPLPGEPLGGAMLTSESGYLSIYPDKIVRFVLPSTDQASLVTVTVASELQFPRAITIMDQTLLVTTVGPLLCDDPGPAFCTPESGLTPPDAEVRTLAQSNGQVWAFPIHGGGSLGPGRQILAGLPVVNNLHALNALTSGADGRVYATIGNVDRLSDLPERLDETGRNDLHLLGTVISFRPDGADLQVHAKGLRNPFDLAWGRDGALYTADNDGRSAGGFRAEEVLRIVAGDDFGFPSEGTFDPGGRRTSLPLWIREVVASSGVEWGETVGLGPGLVMGALNTVEFLSLDFSEGSPVVRTKPAITRLFTPSGTPTVVEALAGNRLLLAVYGDGGEIVVLSVSEND